MTAKAVVLATVTGKTLGVVIKLLGRNLPAREAGLGTLPEDLQIGRKSVHFSVGGRKKGGHGTGGWGDF